MLSIHGWRKQVLLYICNRETVKPEEPYIDAYVNECIKYKSAISSTCRIRIILYYKYEKSNLDKVMTKQFQRIYIEEQERLLSLLHRFEYLFNSTLGTWNTTPVNP